MISRTSSSSFFSHTASTVASRAISSLCQASRRTLVKAALITATTLAVAVLAKYLYSTIMHPAAMVPSPADEPAAPADDAPADDAPAHDAAASRVANPIRRPLPNIPPIPVHFDASMAAQTPGDGPLLVFLILPQINLLLHRLLIIGYNHTIFSGHITTDGAPKKKEKSLFATI